MPFSKDGFWRSISYHNATEEEREAAYNGLGPEWMGLFRKLVPNTIYGLSVREAIRIHDFEYTLGGSKVKKEAADHRLFYNLKHTIDMNGGFKWLKALRKRRAWKYYMLTRNFGDAAFFKE